MAEQLNLNLQDQRPPMNDYAIRREREARRQPICWRLDATSATSSRSRPPNGGRHAAPIFCSSARPISRRSSIWPSANSISKRRSGCSPPSPRTEIRPGHAAWIGKVGVVRCGRLASLCRRHQGSAVG